MSTDATALAAAIAMLERGEIGVFVDTKIALACGTGPDVDHYTSSLDAAVTLVPEDCDGIHIGLSIPAVCQITARHVAFGGRGSTPAAALTLACLRARLAMLEDGA